MSELGSVTSHHTPADLGGQEVQGMGHVTQVDPSSLQDFKAKAILGKILHTLLGDLYHSFLRCYWLVVRSWRADETGKREGRLPAIEQEVGGQAGRLLQGVEGPDSPSDCGSP